MTAAKFKSAVTRAAKAIGCTSWKVIDTEDIYGAACTFKGEKYEMTFAKSGYGAAFEADYRAHIVNAIKQLGAS